MATAVVQVLGGRASISDFVPEYPGERSDAAEKVANKRDILLAAKFAQFANHHNQIIGA